MKNVDTLKEKARWVRVETLKAHGRVPESRIASSLSPIELLVVLYYGGILRLTPRKPADPDRDRVIISKGHGGIALYPILADLGFFSRTKLERFGHPDSFLTAIPDPNTPGFETINGSLGHGLGVACGIALALRQKKSRRRVYVLCGDGELGEGAIWEAVMFAAYHRLGNVTLVVDDNNRSMLGNQDDILRMRPIEKKLAAFGWNAVSTDGHDIAGLLRVFIKNARSRAPTPRAIICRTKKGRGVPELEKSPLCHIMSLSRERVEELVDAHG
ncbi:MAG: transketolase [Chitinispirillaceae bacterium]|nr:transketolase [Chitinispirillaceae bacterium]